MKSFCYICQEEKEHHDWKYTKLQVAEDKEDCVYDNNATSWENLLTKTDMSANTDFSNTTSKTGSTSKYYDGNGFVYARVYTEYKTTLRIDKFTIEAGDEVVGGFMSTNTGFWGA